jgi:S-adenosylmethionine hydrolase
VSILTLTTDFGNKDGFVGTMKGVIWGICPDVQIADITHEISPQNVLEGAYVLLRAAAFFPNDSVHVAVIDPGVGTGRRPIAARIGRQFYVAPDNGLLTPIIEEAEISGDSIEIVHTDNPKYWLLDVSRTFHGRDIFAPVGAHLAAGISLAELGSPVNNPIRLQMPRPIQTADGWQAHITHVDVFGNLATDLPANQLNPDRNILVRLRGHEIMGVVTSYGHREIGDLVALIDSQDFLEVAVVNGSAAGTLGAQVGDVVEVIYR